MKDIAKRFEDAMDTINSDTDMFEFLSNSDPKRIKYLAAKEKGEAEIKKLVSTIQGMPEFKLRLVQEDRIPSYIRDNSNLVNPLRDSLERLESVSAEIEDIMGGVRAKYDAVLGTMELPDDLFPYTDDIDEVELEEVASFDSPRD